MIPVTVLGLGPMGRALAAAFAAAGHPTTVWNRTPGKAYDLDVTVAESAAGAIAASPLTVVSVLDYRAVRSVLDAGTLKGRTLVNLTGGSPRQARETAEWAAAHGIGYLDGLIMGAPAAIGGPDATLLFSGQEDAYLAHRPTLAALGGNAAYLGADPGRAAGFDAAMLDAFWTSLSGVVHAFRLAAAENIAAADIAGYVKVATGLLPDLIDVVAEHVTAGHYPGDESTMLSAAASMDHVLDAVRANDLDDGVLSSARAAVQRAIDAGHGPAAFTRLAAP
ncbi:NAD(P)-binding domain-containing protein [Nonomuraea rubra]|uniref:3-hydroxyisobutyrate dehydrogenase-like beta-hydroxyacid dehydrogenase n=1 Tax=Nonomuraea rubra TaxID=46180 RepID=A0A7X0NS00_9ACTN|nr:NAD(P)-binding domain-containing protein [Nonomuraea rubra]MBB6548516.1 3-hydroxyisobutyrate dehydrogenase-like beta-hydroxyacid dehydrogenase [Nonomuraea rubra]